MRCLFLFSILSLLTLSCWAEVALVPSECEVAVSPGHRLAALVIDQEQNGNLSRDALKDFTENPEKPRMVPALVQENLRLQPFLLERLIENFNQLSEDQYLEFIQVLGQYKNASQWMLKQQNSVSEATASVVEFIPIPRGVVKHPTSVKRGWQWYLGVRDHSAYYFDYKDLKLDYELEMMSTHVTVGMMNDVTGIRSEENLDIEAPFQGSSSFWKALLFANELSRLQGLLPIYNIPEPILNAIRSGTPTTPQMSDKIKDLVIDYKGENQGRSGYRLPTIHEWKYILSGVEGLSEARIEIKSVPNFQDVVFLNVPAGVTLAPHIWPGTIPRWSRRLVVAERKPFSVFGQKVFDLYDFAHHWLHPVKNGGWGSTHFFRSNTDVRYDYSRSGYGSIPVPADSIQEVSSDVLNDLKSGFRLVREVYK